MDKIQTEDSPLEQEPIESDYFAAASPDEIGSQLMAKVTKFQSYLTSSSLVELWRTSYKMYYGLSNSYSNYNTFEVGSIQASGAEGEIAKVRINSFRNLLTHLLVLTTGQRPALEVRPINTDSASIAQAYLGTGLIEYFLREQKIERNTVSAVESAICLGEGWIGLDWNASAGNVYATGPNGQPIMDGDIEAKTYTPFDVIKDTTKPSSDNPDWIIFKNTKNRYDLSAKYKSLAKEILNLSQDTEKFKYENPINIIGRSGFGKQETDDVVVYAFYHRKSEALPNGRFVLFCDASTVLYDGALPFEEIPCYRVAFSDILGTPFAYTVAFDLLGIQMLIDKLYSVVSSNQLAAGVQNFWQPPGNSLERSQMAGGLNLLESVTKPEVLELLKTPAEVFSYINKLEQMMQTLSGVSSVAQGQVDKDLSGTALAFLQSQSITFNSGLQNSYNQLLESVGSGILGIIKDYAATPRVALISGAFNRPLLREYVGSDISAVSRCYVDATSAISKTTSGKLQIADQLLAHGLIDSPEIYIEVLETGKIQTLYQGKMSQILLVQSENEAMHEGKPVKVLITDKHKLHILEHASVLANPESRFDEDLCQRVTDHIQDHINTYLQLQQQNPALLALMSEEPLPTPQPAPQAPQQAQQQPQGNSAASAPVKIAQTLNTVPEAQQRAQSIKAPRAPSLPKGTDSTTQQAYAQLQNK